MILDLGLPRLDGIDVAKRIRKDSDVPILMLTAREGLESRVAGLDAGADDYLVKPFERQELLARVRAMLRRTPPRDSEWLKVADLRLSPAQHQVFRDEREIDLTQREFELLEYLMRNERLVVTRDTLLEDVWGYVSPGETNTVDVFVSNLRRKLEAARRATPPPHGARRGLCAEGTLMSRPRLISRFDMLPIRWRLAVTSAILTFAILLAFAVVIGFFTEREMRSDFDSDIRQNADLIHDRVRIEQTVDGSYRIAGRDELVELASADDVVIRILNSDGDPIAQTTGAPDLGLPAGGLRDVGEYRVTSRELDRPFEETPVAYVQYAKSKDALNGTIARLRVFLALGVLGGGALALLAGLAVARRAMEPITGLTATARRVAKTRDPDVDLPRLRADDEIADLSRTLDDMLSELDAAHTETEGALARQRQFVADASHELRTPLTSILANLELLEGELEGEDREIAGSALRSSQRMRRLVADLLLLARADAGRQAPREAVDMATIVREAAGEAAPLAERHELEVVADTPVIVDGSADDLHRLTLNLIQNSLVHTPPGTRVCVRLQAEDGAVLEVEDDGPGVPAELRHRLFERFVRGHGDTGGGSGLGLAIVRAVAETHGGSVELGENEGGGARFVVRLPPARARQTAAV